MKFIDYKNRFINALRYFQTENSKLAANLIEKLPDEPDNEFHRIFLISQLISITLEHITLNDFEHFSDDSRRIVFAALFDERIENDRNESLDISFDYYNKNRERCEANGETLDSIFNSILSLDEENPPTMKDYFIDTKQLFTENNYLKETCDLFLVFYKKSDSLIKASLEKFPDSLLIKDFDIDPNFENVNLLDEGYSIKKPASKKEVICRKNTSTVIKGMVPCLGIIIVGMNDQKQSAYSACHALASVYLNEKGLHRLYKHIWLLIETLKMAGYSQDLRFFLTGASMSSFSLALNLLMHALNQPEWNLGMNIHLLPSIQGYKSHCVIESQQNGISIRVGAEPYDPELNIEQSIENSEEMKDSKEDDEFEELSNYSVFQENQEELVNKLNNNFHETLTTFNFFKEINMKRKCDENDPKNPPKLKKGENEEQEKPSL